MTAMQKLQVIFIATHDSIGIGDLGPTHQPTEVAVLFRAMPDFLYLRPADGEEVADAWLIAIQNTRMPTMISLSRHQLPQLPGTNRTKVALGGYTVVDLDNADLKLIGVGSELSITVELSQILTADRGLRARIVSMPCQKLFLNQSSEYRRSVLQRYRGRPVIAVEAFTSFGWARFADAGFSVNSFGHNLSMRAGYFHFGFEPRMMADRVQKYLTDFRDGVYAEEPYVDL